MISIPFLHLKCEKWNTEAGADGADGAPEMEPPAAAWSLLSLPDHLRLPQSLYFGWLLLWGHLRRVENDFDPFFTPKMFKMEFIRRCPAEPDGMVAETLKRNPANHARWPGLWHLSKLPQTIYHLGSSVQNRIQW